MLNAQSAPVFEVASIHQNLSGNPNTRINLLPGGRLVIVNATLKTLVRNAYGLLSFQFAGAPGWWDSDKYDIQATSNVPGHITDDQLKPMLQDLLKDRFHLEVHWETKDGPVYALVTDGSGPKFHPYNGDPAHGMNMHRGPGKVQMTGRDVPMTELAGNLANQLGRWVVDRTGLPGRYDFSVEWDPEQTVGPSVFTALKEQLGLELKSDRGSVRTLVIDRAEKPTAN
jgi:uncharacterized protein (TIGR03435 family)